MANVLDGTWKTHWNDDPPTAEWNGYQFVAPDGSGNVTLHYTGDPPGPDDYVEGVFYAEWTEGQGGGIYAEFYDADYNTIWDENGDLIIDRTGMPGGVEIPFRVQGAAVIDFYCYAPGGFHKFYVTPTGAPATDQKPTLTKDTSVEIVSPAVPPKAGVDPRPFWMFAAPPPPGYVYNQVWDRRTDTLLPNSWESFQGWSPLKKLERGTSIGGGGGGGSGSSGYVFRSIESILAEFGEGGVQIPATWQPVYATDPDTGETRLTGYLVPPASAGGGGSGSGSGSGSYGPIAYMSYARFPEYETFANGYPKSEEPRIWGEIDIPTLDGVRTFRVSFVKGAQGQWIRDGGGDPLPAYVHEDRRTTSRIAVMRDFPGAPAVSGSPEERRTNFHIGWNAGAESVQIRDGDCYVQFYVDLGAAGAVGLMPVDRAWQVGDALRIERALYFDRDNAGGLRVCAMESGRRVSPYRPCSSEDRLRIAREKGVVRYEVNGEIIFASDVPSGGPLKVVSALYRGGDGIY